MSWSKEEIYWQFSDKIQPLMISFLRKCYFTYQLVLIFILRCNLSTDPLLNAPNKLNRHSKRFNKIQLFPSVRSTKNKVSIFSNHILSRYRESLLCIPDEKGKLEFHEWLSCTLLTCKVSCDLMVMWHISHSSKIYLLNH